MLVPATDLVPRFRRDTEELIGRSLGDDQLLVAVSGGPDSLALLLLAHAAYEGRVHAATVDHRLRTGSTDEARIVANLCAARGIDHSTLTPPDELVFHAASVQGRARGVRYLLLTGLAASLGCRWLATGHHLDDQAETLLMRMARGSGLPGLAAIRARRHQGGPSGVEVVRPLLGWRRETLRSIVRDAGIAPVDDPSNTSPAHDRTHYRALLSETPLLRPERLAVAASHLGDCEEALAWTMDREWGARITIESDEVRHADVTGLPRELRRRVVMRAIDEVRFELGTIEEWRRDKVGRLLGLLDAGRAATLADVKCTGGLVWRFEPAPPRRLADRS